MVTARSQLQSQRGHSTVAAQSPHLGAQGAQRCRAAVRPGAEEDGEHARGSISDVEIKPKPLEYDVDVPGGFRDNSVDVVAVLSDIIVEK